MVIYPEPIPVPPKPQLRIVESYGYRIVRAEPTSREPQGRMLATAGHDLYGDYVTWGGSHFIYPPDARDLDSLLLVIAGERM